MQVIQTWTRGVREYREEYAQMEGARPERCSCGCTKFHKWGKYERYVIDEDSEDRIYIPRVRCVKCGKTYSALPSFCLSGVSYSAEYVMNILSALILKQRCELGERRRRAYAYLCRFVSRESQWIVFLRALGFGAILGSGRERIVSVFTELLRLFEEGTLLPSFLRETGRHFMCGKWGSGAIKSAK